MDLNNLTPTFLFVHMIFTVLRCKVEVVDQGQCVKAKKSISSGASFYTIVTEYNGTQEAVDCHVHSVRYDVCEKVVLVYITKWDSSDNLRGCSNADSSEYSMSSGV